MRTDPAGDTADDAEHDGSTPRGALAYGTTRFALFGEVLFVGAIVLVLSLPVVTAVAAVAVGVRHLRRHVVGETDSVRRLLRDLLPALRDLWPLGLFTPVALVLLAYNVWLGETGVLPGGQAVSAVSVVVGAGVVVVALRVAGTWVPGQHWWLSVRAAVRRAGRDFGGSLLLIAAVVMCGVLVWMLTPLVLVVGGLLVLAVLAVEHRRGQPPIVEDGAAGRRFPDHAPRRDENRGPT